MPVLKISIKHGKTVYSDVVLDTSTSVASFKAGVYSLTGVPPERQKLMAKGGWSTAGFVGTLKDDFDLANIKIGDGAVVNLMGAADTVQKPAEKVVFIEDMTAEQVAAQKPSPAGLHNLGNTCYMNSTLQCLRGMPELRAALGSVTEGSGAGGSSLAPMAAQLRDLLNDLDRTPGAVAPQRFTGSLRANFPNFAQQGRGGGFMQHDAEELLSVVHSVLKDGLASVDKSLDTYMNIKMQETMTCKESDAEPAKVRSDTTGKLTCNMQQKTRHLKEGVMLGLESEVEAHSDVLGRNAIWTKKQRMSQLPQYICVHYMRFFWKETPDSRDHAGVKCKVVKELTFADSMDVYDMCAEPLQKQMAANRLEVDRKLDEEMEKKRAKLTSTEDEAATTTAAAAAAEPDAISMDVEGPGGTAATATGGDEEDEDAAMAAALAMSLSDSGAAAATTVAAPVFGPGIPDSFTGDYELMGVVTHKGRDADSGHYIGWVRQEPGSSFWWKCDDDKVSEVQTEEILALKGGGDWHTAYLSFYRYKA